jgi:hypothetical protein
MRYEEPPYFLIGLGLLFVAWGSLAYFRIVDGTPWIAFAGGVLILISISVFYNRRATSRTVQGTLSDHNGEKVELSKLAEELEMSEKELRAAIVDLRAEGRINAGFDKNTGQVMIGEPKGVAKASVPVYCAYCRYPLPPGAKFCPSCGSSVD